MKNIQNHITPVELSPGLNLDGFEVQERLGEGNFGIVARAVEAGSGNDFALKMLKLWTVPEFARQNLVSRFRLEFETGQISSDFLVKTRHYGHWGAYPFFVMDYCPNGNLRRQLSGGMSFETAQAMALDMLFGLRALHEHGKTHRDLKPENVLIDAHQRARLTDFGIAGHLNAQFTVLKSSGSPNEVFGSYNYMAPEQLKPLTRRDTLLPTIDIFAFGVICFELFTGRLPFGPWEVEDDMIPYLQRSQGGSWDKLTSLNPTVPEVWESIVEGCLAPDYRYRFQQVDEILQTLGLGKNGRQQAGLFPLGLTVLNGEEHGRVYDLRAVSEKIIGLGRALPGCRNHIEIREEYSAFISRFHATIELHPGAWYLRDGQWQQAAGNWQWLPSKNGTYLNGVEVDSAGQLLHPGDVITVGNTTLKVISL